ncbi:MAG: TlpA family protein disulfide reductase [Acidimicrobiia bacterium]
MPVVDSVAADYQDDVAFLAVAAKGTMDATADAAASLFSDNIAWGLDEEQNVWDLYGVPGQPATVLIARGVVVDMWFGVTSPEFLRERLDRLVSLA